MIQKFKLVIPKLPFIAIFLIELLICFLLIYMLMVLSSKHARTLEESLYSFLPPYALIYGFIKLGQYVFKKRVFEVLPFAYISVSYLLQFHTTLERLAGNKNLTDSVMIITLMLVIINSIDKGFDSYKRFKETKESQ